MSTISLSRTRIFSLGSFSCLASVRPFPPEERGRTVPRRRCIVMSHPPRRQWQVVAAVLLISIGTKLLTLNADLYRSTDLEVHRNWMAITSNLHIAEWYGSSSSASAIHAENDLSRDDTTWTGASEGRSYARMINATHLELFSPSACSSSSLLPSHGEDNVTGASRRVLRLSEWTLDYPPFFAYFERVLAEFASVLSTRIASLESEYLDDAVTVGFMRGSVIVSELIGVLLVVLFCTGWTLDDDDDDDDDNGQRGDDARKLQKGIVFGIEAFALTMLNPGLFIVDHVHFQYNGMLLSLLLASLLLLRGREARPRAAAFVFAVLLFMKHLFVMAVPPMGVYLIAKYCTMDARGVRYFLSFGLIAVGVSAAALLPFVVTIGPMGSSDTGMDVLVSFVPIQNMLQRLFPFGRGLVHDYLAANAWAVYIAADKLAAMVMGTSISGGSGDGRGAQMKVLPEVTPIASLMCVLLVRFVRTMCVYCSYPMQADTRTTRTRRCPSYHANSRTTRVCVCVSVCVF